ncbi:hypothetical protein [Rathayibacter sp. VKM Ac-2928]|uniref:hypothetical protein n=1 Tax=Rathayibacter sp. VKM Ac-2928 TaxID=2929479 RepID=UPI001FB530F5|nr:hypothetical protein [Rathayibacter sp. VKM Ac-2928]MCJ1682336.1 hypothetical protein [Rathayibacter sp. VKM Ac-2928]
MTIERNQPWLTGTATDVTMQAIAPRQFLPGIHYGDDLWVPAGTAVATDDGGRTGPYLEPEGDIEAPVRGFTLEPMHMDPGIDVAWIGIVDSGEIIVDKLPLPQQRKFIARSDSNRRFTYRASMS